MSEESVLPLYETYKITKDADRSIAYKDALFRYAADIIAGVCTRKSEQWEPLSRLQPGLVLFSFSNHQRLVFSRRGDRLMYRFRTRSQSRRLSGYSFRCLWVVQSPVFQDAITIASPLIDKGSIYLTFSELSDTFTVRVCWTDEPVLAEGEVVVQPLVDYNLPEIAEEDVPEVPEVPEVPDVLDVDVS